MDAVSIGMLVLLAGLASLIMVPERAWHRVYTVWDSLIERLWRS